MTLYHLNDPGDLLRPTLIAAFEGWVDAGEAATSAASQLGTDGVVVATFENDLLFDYRSQRPTLEILHGKPARLSWPEIVVRRHRLGAHDLLVMTGPEPDYRWRELAHDAVEMAQRLGVAEWLSLGAIPAAVPHTRPVPVMGTASSPGLLRGGVEPGPEGMLRVPSAALSVLDMEAAGTGIPSVGYFAQIPHYVRGPYPAAAVELLRVVGRHTAEEVDPGSLVDDAQKVRAQLDAAAAADEATRAYVERLESMVDEARQPSGDDLIAEIEQYLRERGREGNERS